MFQEDDNESPLSCALRETKEEIGLDVPNLQFVGIYYCHKKGVSTDSLKFIFWGGVLTEDQIQQIKLQNDELIKYTFSSLEKALPLLSNSLQKSVPKCLEAIENKTFVYIE